MVGLGPARLAAALGCVGLVLLASGCQSTQSKSAELAEQAGAASNEKGLEITRKSREVKVRGVLVLNDRNGTAAVVELTNTGRKTLVDVPIAIDVLERGRKVFSNDAPGLEPSLVSVAALSAGESIAWVNDQVFAPGSKVRATVGATRGGAPRKLPEIHLTAPRLGGDPTSGVAAEGRVTNRSRILQRKLVIYAVARRGRRIVAAGRGQVERLGPGRAVGYQLFFIGNPKGAELELAAPPTTFE
jgi:hypothetical protein